MTEERIDIDDKVIVRWETLIHLTGTIIGVPYASGDAWKIRGVDGKLYYVQAYCLMEKEP